MPVLATGESVRYKYKSKKQCSFARPEAEVEVGTNLSRDL